MNYVSYVCTLNKLSFEMNIYVIFVRPVYIYICDLCISVYIYIYVICVYLCYLGYAMDYRRV